MLIANRFFYALCSYPVYNKMMYGEVLRMCNGYFILKSVNRLLQKVQKTTNFYNPFWGCKLYGGSYTAGSCTYTRNTTMNVRLVTTQ